MRGENDRYTNVGTQLFSSDMPCTYYGVKGILQNYKMFLTTSACAAKQLIVQVYFLCLGQIPHTEAGFQGYYTIPTH